MRDPVPEERVVWDVHGAWCSTHGEHPSQKSQLYKTDRGNTVVVAMVINPYELYFLRACLEENFSVTNYKFIVR